MNGLVEKTGWRRHPFNRMKSHSASVKTNINISWQAGQLPFGVPANRDASFIWSGVLLSPKDGDWQLLAQGNATVILKLIRRQADTERKLLLHHQHPAFESRLEHKLHRCLHRGFVSEIATNADRKMWRSPIHGRCGLSILLPAGLISLVKLRLGNAFIHQPFIVAPTFAVFIFAGSPRHFVSG